jgi:hypothetical protein
MDHRGMRRDRKNVACDFDGAFFRCSLDFLDMFWIGVGADAPDIGEDCAGVTDEERREFAVVAPCTRDGLFEDFLCGFVEVKVHGRNIGLDAIHADVTLALLLGIIKRVRVKKGPHELATDIFETEFEGGMLEDGVMPAIKCSGANVKALFVSDLFWGYEVVCVTSASRGDCGIERMIKKIAKSYPRR